MADVLIVEDAALQRTIIGRFLEPDHTIVGSAADGDEAIELVEKYEPDVVIMDVNLPTVDGLTAATEIKSHSPETKIVVSTAVVNDDVKAIAERIPTEGFLIKPYSGPELRDAIENAIE